ncbi:spondin domain-containing protein [Alteromonas sp. LMIT007]|uniref:Spondin domain-containing protein n=2 Tax=Opacimonas viscosa TaxID=2961944 RepID=A0AA41X610_9ALTE|nr:spondin domain-containing protein [Opacimonas viscosa]MCP3429239.1 spondin domain-containing protein [Opacimonas viscosa]
MAPLTQAADLDITIQNLTSGMSFTPILAVAHTPDASLFEVGEAASAELQAMAEGGSLDGLASIGATINADALANPAGGLLLPGMSTTGDLMTADGNTVLSVVAMILPTNDGFIGLDNWTIPTEAGTYTVYVNAYDAGTEANDEIRGGGAPGTPGMPVPPPLADAIGENGSGVTTTSNNMTVHIHPGNIGDADQAAGVSDVQNTVHRWLNPVAKVTIVVN